MKVSKLTALFVAMLLCVFMASTAMAINVTNRSAEMDDFSPCDRAGTIQMVFEQSDWTNIAAYLAVPTNNYALIRIALGGQNLPASPTLPLLCKDITGSVDGAGLGANGGDLPYGDLVPLNDVGIEISNHAGVLPALTDANIYVHGTEGDQYLEVFITALNAPAAAYLWISEADSPWFKIGIDVAGGVDEDTSICAQVTSYSGVSLLTISNEAIPQTLTFSGDNEIGHFISQQVDIRDCDKIEDDLCEDTTLVELCPLGGTVQSPACPSYYKCFVAEGDFPISSSIDLVLRTNGAENGDNTQEGVYFKSISIFDESGTEIIPVGGWTYRDSDGVDIVANMPCDYWLAEVATATIDSAQLASAGNELKFCVKYTVNPEQAQANTDARFWTTGTVVPCGSLWNEIVNAAELIDCDTSGSGAMYFPYVLTQTYPWMTGICVTNMNSNAIPSEMVVTFTLTDSTGTSFTYTKSDFTTTVWTFTLDSILSEFDGTPAPGAAWLHVQTNFSVDGYEYFSDGTFGAGTLPRLSR